MSDDHQHRRNFARDIAKTIEIESVEASVSSDEVAAPRPAKTAPASAPKHTLKRTFLRLAALNPLARIRDTAKRITGGTTPVTQFATNDYRTKLGEEQLDAETRIEGLNDVQDDFLLEDEIATGGQGSISRARDRKFSRIVAVKSLHGELKDRPEYRRAFITEAKITAQLEHPSIIPVYGIYGDTANGLHLAMKLVRGKTLSQYLSMLREQYEIMSPRLISRSESTILKQRLEYFQRVCEAISYVHHNQVIHRDLKPDNIMIGNFNETYVMDWGIAEQVETDPDACRRKKPSGTLQYISPEVINRQPYDCRSDIYLLGLILFEIVFLKPAYDSKDNKKALAIAKAAAVAPYAHAFNCAVDEDLVMIIRKALALKPEDRYQTVDDLLADVRGFLQAERVAANPHRFWGEVRYQFRRHYKGLTLAGGLLLLLLLSLSSFSLYRENLSQRRQKQTELVFSEVFTNGLLCGARYDRRMKDYEKMVADLAKEASWRLADAQSRQLPPVRVYIPRDGLEPITAPPSLGYAEGYQQKISLAQPVCVTAPGVDLAPFQHAIAALTPMRPSWLRLLTIELADVSGDNDDELCKAFFSGRRPLFNWVYISLAAGLHLSYPYHSDYPDGYDPRQRPWYQAALAAAPGQAVWGGPYVDSGVNPFGVITCSQALRDKDGQILGVVGADISVETLVAMLSRTGNNGPFVKNKYLINSKGTVIAQSGKQLLPWQRQGNPHADTTFHNLSLLRAMWLTRNGRLFTTENNKQYFYFFMHIETLNWLYIERMDYLELLTIKHGQDG